MKNAVEEEVKRVPSGTTKIPPPPDCSPQHPLALPVKKSPIQDARTVRKIIEKIESAITV